MSVHRVVLSSVGYRVACAFAGVVVLGALIVQLNSSLNRVGHDSKVFGERAARPARVSREQPSTKVKAERESLEMRARSDMRAYAIAKDVVIEGEDAFTARPDWREQWSLYHVDVHTGHDVVRIYEAVNRIHPSQRFTAMWLPDAESATNWQPVPDR